MTYKQEKLDIEGFFQTNWADTVIVFENGPASTDPEWVRLTVQNGEARQVTMGDAPEFRYPGVVYVQIFTPKDVGSGRALELADKAEALFKTLVLGKIHFKVPRVTKVPSNAEHYQVNVSTEFYRGS